MYTSTAKQDDCEMRLDLSTKTAVAPTSFSATSASGGADELSHDPSGRSLVSSEHRQSPAPPHHSREPRSESLWSLKQRAHEEERGAPMFALRNSKVMTCRSRSREKLEAQVADSPRMVSVGDDKHCALS